MRMQPPVLNARSIASARRRSSAARVNPSGNGLSPARRFHNQDIDAGFGKDGARGDRLVVEIDIAAVENRAAFRAQNHPGRAEDVAGIDEFDREARPLSPGALALQGERLAQRTPAPSVGRAIRFLMGEERINHDADLFALPHHDADGIMQKRAADFRGRFRHENRASGWRRMSTGNVPI